MKLLTASIIGGFAQAMSSLVGRVLTALSLGFVTFTGIQTGISSLTSSIESDVNSLGPDVVQFLAYCWVDKALTMIFSAWVATLAIKLGGSSTLRRLVVH